MYSIPYVGGGITKSTRRVLPQCDRENCVAAPMCAEITAECLLNIYVDVKISALDSQHLPRKEGVVL